MTCETQQLALSCLLDHELPAAEMPETLDHILDCDDCAQFYREARRLDAWRDPAGASEPAPVHRLAPRRWWPVAIAAALVLGVGLSWSQVEWPGAQSRLDEVIEAGSSSTMSDARFVDLTVELLQANPRYHLEMLDVLHQAHDLDSWEVGPWPTSLVREDRDRTDRPAEIPSLMH